MKTSLLDYLGIEYFLLIIFLFFQLNGLAQTKSNGGFGYFSFGAHALDNDNLNSVLRESGIPETGMNNLSFGGGGAFIVNNYIFGGEGHGFFPKHGSNNEYTTLASGGGGSFLVGYLLVNKPRAFAYPAIGLGACGYQLEITENASSNFEQVMADPKRSSRLTTGAFLLDLSLNGMLFTHEGGGFAIGISAGYTFTLDNNEWYINRSPNTGFAPAMDLSGAYVKLRFGGGGKSN